MAKKPNRRTPEELAASRAVAAVLEARIDQLATELEAAGSVYARVDRRDALTFAVRRIEAELGTPGNS
jgi:tRNA(Ser,Leu) C12 N-acetylase TAN1